jgi:hypothetical protein
MHCWALIPSRAEKNRLESIETCLRIKLNDIFLECRVSFYYLRRFTVLYSTYTVGYGFGHGHGHMERDTDMEMYMDMDTGHGHEHRAWT